MKQIPPDTSVDIEDQKRAENFYYLDLIDGTIMRHENYLYMYDDTQVTISKLEYSKSHTTEEFQKITEDTLTRYAAEYQKIDFQKDAYHHDPSKLQSLKDKVMPELILTNMDGKQLSTNDLSGKVILLDFSYSSCMPCHLAIPDLKKLCENYHDKGVQVLCADYLDRPSDIAYLIRKNSINYPIYSVVYDDLIKIGVQGYPTFLILDSNKVIKYISDGYSEKLYENLSEQIDSVIAKR
ncbi:MAG: TlpA disulfide reductase family protein [bacterium]